MTQSKKTPFQVAEEAILILFIIASPRTGSTFIYQLMIEAFGFCYFSNYINDYHAFHPAVGMSVDYFANPRNKQDFKSDYGKTTGLFGASEASSIFKNWFGGEHPSQIKSAYVINGKEEHIVKSINSIVNMTRKPLVTKNAWNCFRIAELCRLFPNSYFIWVRRDIVSSSISDLEARYRRGGPEIWNSATTANYKDIQKLPYWEQVVEQQYWYNYKVEMDLNSNCPNNFFELWYEEVLYGDASNTLKKMSLFFDFPSCNFDEIIFNSIFEKSKSKNNESEDYRKIKEFVNMNIKRFSPYLHDE